MGLNRWLRNSVIFGGDKGRQDLAREWTRSLWSAGLWRGNQWLGVEIWQWPTDLLVMQEIMFEQKPKIVLETGTANGGSAIFYSSVLSMMGGGGKVISVDVQEIEEVRDRIRNHPFGGAVTQVYGDSKAPETVAKVKELIGDETRILVTLDSLHTYSHVLEELRAYADLVPVGGSLVVFDTICEYIADLPGKSEWKNDNPMRSVNEFLQEDNRFERDPQREKLRVSMAPGGFLRRVR